MTTIIWDLKTLSADTLVSDSAAMVQTGFFTERGWTQKTKLWVPVKHITYEHSSIVAVGASGNVHVGNLIIDYLLDRNLPPSTRPSNSLKADLDTQATAILAAHKEDASLLILTESHCWRLKAEFGKPVDIIDVTAHPTAIGAGAQYAQPCLDAGVGGIRSIIEAARHPASETNFSIDYVERSPSPTIKRAWQSFLTLRDPLRVNRVITRCIAVIGGGLTAAGGIALQTAGFTGTAQILWVALSMVGLVAAVSSMLTSLRDTKAIAYHLLPIAVMVLMLLWGKSASYLESHHLTPLIMLYIATFSVLALLRAQWSWIISPLTAVHFGASLTLGSLLGAVTVFGQKPYNLALLFPGTVGVGLGYAATLLAVKYVIQNRHRHQVIIERC